MRDKFRCNCPITSALDIVGDKWTLVIVKQMLIEGKKTFKDFTESVEAIATNILSSRLKMLEENNIIVKGKLPNNKKTNIYSLTEKGLALTAPIIELALWSDAYCRDEHKEMVDNDHISFMRSNKNDFIQMLQNNYLEQI